MKYRVLEVAEMTHRVGGARVVRNQRAPCTLRYPASSSERGHFFLSDQRFDTPEEALASIEEHAAFPENCIIVPCYG